MTTVEVCIPWRSDGDPWRETARDWVHARWMTLFPEWRIVEADDGAVEGPFLIARALNRCVDASTADVLVMTGADTIIDPRRVVQAVDLAATGKWVMACDTLNRLDRLQTERVLADDPATQAWHQLGTRRTAQLGWGPIVLQRHLALERLWDPRFEAGGEDDGFGVAARCLWGDPARVPQSPAWLMWHESARRAKDPRRDDAVALLQRYKGFMWEPQKMWALVHEWQD